MHAQRAGDAVHAEFVETRGDQQRVLIYKEGIATPIDAQVALEEPVVQGAITGKGRNEAVVGTEPVQQGERGGHLRHGGRVHGPARSLREQDLAVGGFDVDTLVRAQDGPGRGAEIAELTRARATAGEQQRERDGGQRASGKQGGAGQKFHPGGCA